MCLCHVAYIQLSSFLILLLEKTESTVSSTVKSSYSTLFLGTNLSMIKTQNKNPKVRSWQVPMAWSSPEKSTPKCRTPMDFWGRMLRGRWIHLV